MGIHPNYLGMVSHELKTYCKSLLIQSIIILKDKGQRVVGISQRHINLGLERRTIPLSFCLNNVKIQILRLGGRTILAHPLLGKAIDYECNTNILLPIYLGKLRSCGEERVFAAVNAARFLDTEPEDALRKATEKFIRRFQAMESLANERSLDIRHMTLEEMDGLWGEIKKHEA